MHLRAPGKINLFLRVTGKRPDGYHDLISLMCCVGIYDAVSLAFGRKPTRITCAHPDVPEDETNLAYRAADLFFKAAGIDAGVHITIEKQIPVGAGLGGGSSDAAAVLKGLNAHYKTPFSMDELHVMGRSLGADVPFFIRGKPAVATGIGDILQPFETLKRFPVVVVYPSVAVSTAQVYKNWNLRLTINKNENKNDVFRMDWNRDAPDLLANDLEDIACDLCPDIRRAKKALREHGASGSLMSGSGSSVFGLFASETAAHEAFEALSVSNDGWQLFITHMLT